MSKSIRARASGLGIGWLLASTLTLQAQYDGDGESLILADADIFVTNDVFVVGPRYSNDQLIIQSGGLLLSTGGALGISGTDTNGVYNPGINNRALVTDRFSLWNNHLAGLDIGLSGGFCRLVVSNGAAVLSGDGSIGLYDTNGNNSVLITGAGSVWSNSLSAFYIGESGASNSMVINQGGYFFSPRATVAGIGNQVWVSDGSVWSNFDGAFSVDGLLNSVVISNGGKMFSGAGEVGATGGSNNTVLVTGTGSVWTNPVGSSFYLGFLGGGNRVTIANTGLVTAGIIFVGYSGVGNSLVVSNGGVLQANGTNAIGGKFGANIGYTDGANANSAWVTGRGSLWTNASALYVGQSGSYNRLVVTNGGTVINNVGYVGAPGDFNSVLVTDTNSTWVSGSSLAVGSSGFFNSLVVSNGGQVVDGIGFVGGNGGTNTAWVTDKYSVWMNSNDLYVGSFGWSSTLVISNAGAVENQNGYVGDVSGAWNNSVVVTDTNSSWRIGANLYVGYAGSFNSLVVSNGGQVYTSGLLGQGYVGFSESASTNIAWVTDNGSSWSSSAIEVGHAGSFNSLVISNGGGIFDTGCTVGASAGAIENCVWVTGTNSIWASIGTTNVGGLGGALTIGDSGSFNSLVISNCGTVKNTSGFVGRSTGADNNSAVVAGIGSTWTNQYSLDVGSAGSSNSLLISGGGRVCSSGGHIGYSFGASSNTVLVTGLSSSWNNGGDLSVGYSGASNSLWINNGGTVIASNVYIGFNPTSSTNLLTLSGGTLSVAQTLNPRAGTLLINSGLVDLGTFLVTNGSGTTVLLNGGTLSCGATLITNHGLLPVGDGTQAATYHLKGGVHTFGDGLEIHNHATLDGCGTVNGKVLVDPGGKVISSCGSLNFTGPVTNNGTMVAANFHFLETKGLLVNNGVIVFNYAATNFQGGFINNGTLVDAGDTTILKAAPSGQDFVVQIDSNTNLTYQLQYSSTPGSGGWTAIGTPTRGNGGLLTLIDPGGATASSRFYQVVIGGF